MASAALGASAAPVSPEGALSRLSAKGLMHMKGVSSPRLVDVINDDFGNPAIYHYTYSGDRGFMLLPADDAAAPVLGYSPDNSFMAEGLPEHMHSWLSYYSAQIYDAREMALPAWRDEAVATRAGEKEAIAPLLKTRWDQGSPYNNLCPTSGGARCVTGCVATAMAQVMKYWEYPVSGQGQITYNPEELGKDLFLDFSAVTFDWANMLDSYGRNYSSTSARAVAELMQACGYSVRMGYTPYASGARANFIPGALMTNFGYDRDVTYKEASVYRDTWEDIVYNDLATVGPVIYSGVSSGGGHCFVCDGYDGNGYFHINWGWSGMSDGYFLLNALNPSQVGTGGYSGGYNAQQEVTVGIMPPVGRVSLVSTSIDNAASDTGNVSGWGKVYRINDPSNIQLSVKLRISGGHVNSPLYVTIYENDPDTKANVATVFDKEFLHAINASDGVITTSVSASISNFNPSRFYTMNIAYELKGKKTTLDSVRLGASSGVDEVAAEGVDEWQIFDMGGVPLSRVSDAALPAALEGLAPGVYIARGTGADGCDVVRKFVKK